MMIPFAVWTPGIGELLVILVIVLVLFGAGKLPSVFRSMGSALKEFKDAQKDDAMDVTPPRKRELPDAEEAREVEHNKDRVS